jgi:hypothetical protein
VKSVNRQCALLGLLAFGGILPASTGIRSELGADAPHRRAAPVLPIHGRPAIARSAGNGGSSGQPQEGAAPDAGLKALLPHNKISQPEHGHRVYRYLLRGFKDSLPRPGLECRHHLYILMSRGFARSDRDHGLARAPRARMAPIQHPGCWVFASRRLKAALARETGRPNNDRVRSSIPYRIEPSN